MDDGGTNEQEIQEEGPDQIRVNLVVLADEHPKLFRVLQSLSSKRARGGRIKSLAESALLVESVSTVIRQQNESTERFERTEIPSRRSLATAESSERKMPNWFLNGEDQQMSGPIQSTVHSARISQKSARTTEPARPTSPEPVSETEGVTGAQEIVGPLQVPR